MFKLLRPGMLKEVGLIKNDRLLILPRVPIEIGRKKNKMIIPAFKVRGISI